VLRGQLAILRRQVPPRPRYNDTDRLLLSVMLPRHEQEEGGKESPYRTPLNGGCRQIITANPSRDNLPRMAQ
jgi:hypothetical protein